jgi:hypothetical protein
MNEQTTTPTLTGLEKLAQLRDEIRVRIHLARLEARTEWERLEPKWWELEEKVDALETVSKETAKNLKAAAELMIGELTKGYQRIRETL